MPAPRRLAALLVLAACTADPADTTATGTTSATTPATTTTTGATSTSGDGTSPQPTTTTQDPLTTTAPDPTTTADATTGAPLDRECDTLPCFNVINRCPVPLWIHAANNADVVLTPDNATLAPGEARQYAVPAEWPAGRINAYWLDPEQNPEAHDKVEVTVTGGIMNYNITYVDYVALPAEMVAVGLDCPETPDFDPKIGCYVARDALLNGCPDDLRSGDRCLSAGFHCADPAHKDEPYCHALDEQIAACAAQHPETCGVAAQLGDTTWHAYACAGYFDSQPPNCMPASPDCHQDGNKWCAALNRGMLADPESTDIAAYYQTPPYNTYAKWVHDTCPGIYAFAYDDYPANAGESGFRACKADRLDVTFCPAG